MSYRIWLMRSPRRNVLTIMTTVSLLAGMLAAATGPAAAASLTVILSSSVTGPIATIGVTVNRQPKAISSCTAVLVIGVTQSCGNPSSPTKNTTTFQFPLLGGLPSGTFTVTVTVRTTDGGVARASTSFELVLAPCYVTNVTTSSRYDGTGPNLQTAINAATNGDTLRIQGHCLGNFTVVAKALTLVGIAEDDYPLATLDANHSGRVVLVEFSGSNAPTGLTLTNLLITHGDAEGLGGGTINDLGGGIYNNHGLLTLSGSTQVSGNRAAYGGGIASFGTVTLNDSAGVTGNTATVDGGGIYSVGGPVNACTTWTGTISPNTPDDPPASTQITC